MNIAKKWDINNFDLYNSINKDINRFYGIVDSYLKTMLKFNYPVDLKECTERDILDITIEGYSILWCLLNNRDYGTITQTQEGRDFILSSKVLSTLYDYKMLKYGQECLEEIGLEIVDITKKGFLVKNKENIVLN